jgi:hypothetical protein
MAKLLNTAPVLLVKDVVESANYYRDRLGFSYERFWGEPPCFCIVNRDNLSVFLSQVPAEHIIVPHWKTVEKMWNIYFWVDDAEQLYDEFRKRGAKIDYELYVAPHNCKEFGVQDLDGYDIAFGQSLDE